MGTKAMYLLMSNEVQGRVMEEENIPVASAHVIGARVPFLGLRPPLTESYGLVDLNFLRFVFQLKQELCLSVLHFFLASI